MSRHVTSCHVMYLMSRHSTSCYVMSYHVMSRHVTSCHVMSHLAPSCHVMSYHVTSYHVENRGTVTRPTLHCQLTSSTRNQFKLSMTVFVGCPEGCRYNTASVVYDLVHLYSFININDQLHKWCNKLYHLIFKCHAADTMAFIHKFFYALGWPPESAVWFMSESRVVAIKHARIHMEIIPSSLKIKYLTRFDQLCQLIIYCSDSRDVRTCWRIGSGFSRSVR